MAKECKVVQLKTNNQEDKSILDKENSKLKASSVYYESLLGIEKMISDHFDSNSSNIASSSDSA